MDHLTALMKEYAISYGAVRVGFATLQTLKGGPPSTDLEFILPGARSAISIAVPLNKDFIRAFLAKKDRISHERDNKQTNMKATGIAAYLAQQLEQRGYPAKGVVANESYREGEGWKRTDMHPDLSHRYVAVRSGVGWFGLSGNVLTPQYGAAVILATCVTAAALESTDPLPPEENYCNRCKLCFASCCSGMMDPKMETTVTLGQQEFHYSARRSYHRCDFVCGGMTGLHPSKKWSTWSPGRFPMPEEDQAFRDALIKGLKAYNRRPPLEEGAPQILMRGKKIYQTCGNCQLLCWPDLEDRKENYRLLTSSGAIIQKPDGSLERVSAQEAEAYVMALGEERRSLYI